MSYENHNKNGKWERIQRCYKYPENGKYYYSKVNCWIQQRIDFVDFNVMEDEMKKYRTKLPDDFKFDRDEANER